MSWLINQYTLISHIVIQISPNQIGDQPSSIRMYDGRYTRAKKNDQYVAKKFTSIFMLNIFVERIKCYILNSWDASPLFLCSEFVWSGMWSRLFPLISLSLSNTDWYNWYWHHLGLIQGVSLLDWKRLKEPKAQLF
jgi:hypothetical protein